jgi:hypothetical protein
VKWGPARDEHRQLSTRYATSNDPMKLSMQTLASIDTGDAFDFDSAIINNSKQMSDVPITCF